MKYVVRSRTYAGNKELCEVFEIDDNETYHEVEANNKMDAVRQVKNRKNYLEGLDLDDFDLKLSDLVDGNSTEVETWNLDMKMLVILYQKLNEYYQVASENIDMEYPRYTNYYLKEVTEKELLEEILQQIRDMCKIDKMCELNVPQKRIATIALFHNISEVFHRLWW